MTAVNFWKKNPIEFVNQYVDDQGETLISQNISIRKLPRIPDSE